MIRPNKERLQPGDRVKFAEERLSYMVQAASHRFAICTKPFNPRHTVLYSVVDYERNVRGTEDLIFCMGFETKHSCREALARLEKGKSSVSYRNFIPLKIERVVRKRHGQKTA